MRHLVILLIASVLTASCVNRNENAIKPSLAASSEIMPVDMGDVSFDSFFLDKTMRFDFFHSGTAMEEHFAKDQIVSDGVWSGSKKVLLDRLNLGLYFYEVVDKETGTLLYSRGFSSVFGEWQTTPEASFDWGTFHESLRFPWPLKPVVVRIKKRDAKNEFSLLWRREIDPASREVIHADLVHTSKVTVLADNGASAEKVDIVILGDGYSAGEMEKFRKDAGRLAGYLLGKEPFLSRSRDFNIRAVETPGKVSGVSKPHHGVFKRTPLTVHYSSFDSERYALTYDNKTARDIASQVPYDFMVILINERTYGGGGIYNLYTTVSADNKFAEYIMVHEFGHHMASLADEYYTSSVSYEIPEVMVEPWEPNITALFDKSSIKWKDLTEEGTPIPTPWNKEEFDRAGYAIQKERDSLRNAHVDESVMEDLFTRQMKIEDAFFAKEQYHSKVGAFEGAGYLAKGLYRPQIDCIMYTRHLEFCKVCRRSIENVIDQYVK
jgi:hypothetical protein